MGTCVTKLLLCTPLKERLFGSLFIVLQGRRLYPYSGRRIFSHPCKSREKNRNKKGSHVVFCLPIFLGFEDRRRNPPFLNFAHRFPGRKTHRRTPWPKTNGLTFVTVLLRAPTIPVTFISVVKPDHIWVNVIGEEDRVVSYSPTFESLPLKRDPFL